VGEITRLFIWNTHRPHSARNKGSA